MKQNTIRLNEGQLKAVIAESVKRIVNEISSTTIKAAADAGENWREDDEHSYGDWRDIISYDDIFDSIRKIEIALSSFNRPEKYVSSWYNKNFGSLPSGMAEKLLGYMSEIKKFFERKASQHENLSQEGEKREKEMESLIVNKMREAGFQANSINSFNNIPEEQVDDFVSINFNNIVDG